jgi:xanthine dehydrogenase accessory factor
MNLELQRTASQWRAAGRAAVVVEVAAARGSVPRAAGTRMLVALDAVCGSVGGGQLELKAIAQARAMLTAGAAAVEQRVALGPSLGQCCGGALDLRYTPLAAADPAAWPVAAPRFTLQLYGAGHVGRAVARLLEALPCAVQWIDEREHEFPAAAPAPHIERVCVDEVPGEVARAPAGAFYLVMTHSHAIDLAIVHAVLRRGDFGFLGVIGSRSKRASFAHRLRERGVPAELLQRMACPIGLPGIAGKEPEVIAVAVVAQLLQCSAPPAPVTGVSQA